MAVLKSKSHARITKKTFISRTLLSVKDMKYGYVGFFTMDFQWVGRGALCTFFAFRSR